MKARTEPLRHLSSILLILLVLASGCVSTYETKKKSELLELNGRGPLRALTVDSALYTFRTFSFSDLGLNGQGTITRLGIDSAFDGFVPFNRIAFIERIELSVWKGVWVVPMSVAAFAAMIDVMNKPSKFEITRPSGSCPYVYAFDGKTYKLDAETFGTSVSKAFEAETFSLLPSLRPVDGRLKVRVANERPETHLINSVHLFVGDACEASSAVLDINNTLWPVRKAHAPSAASDHSGNNILAEIASKDNRYWKSDLAHTAAFSGFRDELDFRFEVPEGTSEATLIVDAINTDLVTEAYRSAGSVLGDATMEFYDALERDPQLQGSIRNWIRDCSLRIEVKRGSEWKEAGVMTPEANVAPFSRAIRLRNLDGIQGPLRIRLSSLTDVWRIDAVSIDFSAAKPLVLQPLNMNLVRSSDNTHWDNAIAANDSTYALVLPPDHLDLTFDAAPAMGMRTPVYVFAAKGYLYEWLPSSASQSASSIAESMGGRDRVEMFKLLIKQKDLFLPQVYAAWRKNPDFTRSK